MTRSSDSPLLAPFSDPEKVIRTVVKRERRAPVNFSLGEGSVAQSTGDYSSNSDKSTGDLFGNLFVDTVPKREFEMGDNPPAPLTMEQKMRATATGQGNAINQGTIQGDFEVKGAILHMISNKCQFGGDVNEDANEHIRTFNRICGLFHLAAVNDQLVYLRLFPWTLKGEARKWLDSLP